MNSYYAELLHTILAGIYQDFKISQPFIYAGNRHNLSQRTYKGVIVVNGIKNEVVLKTTSSDRKKEGRSVSLKSECEA